MNLGLEGKRALVLGARSGLGAAAARALAAEGAQVVAASRDVAGIAAMAAGIAGITPARVDLADMASIDALVDGLLPDGVDVLVNNSGAPPPGDAAQFTQAQWAAQFSAMTGCLIHITSRLLPPMLARGWGRVITIGSSGIVAPIPRLALSNALRAAVQGWSKTLAAEIAGQGVTVNMVLPGRIRTERLVQLNSANAARAGRSVEEIDAESIAGIPAGRYGKAEEFAAAVAFLAGVPAAYITGSSIRVDGGMIRGV